MTLLINDLEKNKQLDAQAMTNVRGGMAIFANKQVQHFGLGRRACSRRRRRCGRRSW